MLRESGGHTRLDRRARGQQARAHSSPDSHPEGQYRTTQLHRGPAPVVCYHLLMYLLSTPSQPMSPPCAVAFMRSTSLAAAAARAVADSPLSAALSQHPAQAPPLLVHRCTMTLHSAPRKEARSLIARSMLSLVPAELPSRWRKDRPTPRPSRVRAARTPRFSEFPSCRSMSLPVSRYPRSRACPPAPRRSSVAAPQGAGTAGSPWPRVLPLHP